MTAFPDEPLRIASSVASGRHLCFLDRAAAGGWSGLWYDPEAVFRSKDGAGSLLWSDGRRETADGDPFAFLAALLAARPNLTACGYWGYDLRYAVERLPRLAVDDLRLPDCWVGLYAPGRNSALPRPHRPDGQDPSGPSAGIRTGEIQDSLPPVAYERATRHVLEYIAAGDCYQVNLSRRITAPLAGTPWQLYQRLRQVSPAPYAAFLDCGDHPVLSSSPELFLRVQGREVETRPIKGTRARGGSPEEDAALVAELLSSVKDRAELLMIIDLERNDLGRVCEYGSVHVPRLFGLESYSNVHHLVATVRGRLRPEVGPLECLRAAFPGGSITGAPKIRAMEIIEELEPVRRGIYTGAIGWVDGRGNAEWNIAIRTMVVKEDAVHFSVGGGIVADSEPAAEYAETAAKAAGMLRALSPEPLP